MSRNTGTAGAFEVKIDSDADGLQSSAGKEWTAGVEVHILVCFLAYLL